MHYFSRNHYEFTICFPLNSRLLREFTFNPLSLLWVQYEFTICVENSLWINFELTFRIKSELPIWFSNSYRIHYLFAKSRWIQFLFREFTFNSLSNKRIYYLRLFIHYRLTSFISYSISISRTHIEFMICFVNSLWSHLFNSEFTIFIANSPWIHYLFCEFTMTWQSVSQIIYNFTIFIASSLKIHYIIFTKSLWIHHHIREFTLNSLSVSRM